MPAASAEVKRMYTRPSHRGTQDRARIVERIEAAGARQGLAAAGWKPAITAPAADGLRARGLHTLRTGALTIP